MMCMWSTKKLKILAYTGYLEYRSKQSGFSAFYLCILEIFSAVQRQAMNGEKSNSKAGGMKKEAHY